MLKRIKFNGVVFNKMTYREHFPTLLDIKQITDEEAFHCKYQLQSFISNSSEFLDAGHFNAVVISDPEFYKHTSGENFISFERGSSPVVKKCDETIGSDAWIIIY
jgi:hypothetical protein